MQYITNGMRGMNIHIRPALPGWLPTPRNLPAPRKLTCIFR